MFSFPYEAKIGTNGRTKILNSSAEFKDFLRTEEDIVYSWSDGQDLRVLADLYQVNITVHSIKSEDDEAPNVYTITTDESMKSHSKAIKNIPGIKLLYRTNHYDLVI